MGALGPITATGTALALALSWTALKRARDNQQKISELERKLRNFRSFESDTLQTLRGMLQGLQEKIKQIDHTDGAGVTDEFSQLHDTIGTLLSSVSTTEESRKLDYLASEWLYTNQRKLAEVAVDSVLNEKSEFRKRKEKFINEMVTCLAMTAGMIKIDNPDALVKVWNRFPKHSMPESFYILALQEVVNLIEPELTDIQNEKDIVMSYLKELIDCGDRN